MSETKAAQQPVGASEMDPFAGGGEMGALMRATDWSQTKLGPLESWPMSLKAVLGTLLRSRFPMLLWWGPELLHLYNDAYRPILRDKHPASLGAPAAEVWAEVWDVAGPLARGVQAGGPATWVEDLQLLVNSGTMTEETYFTFSYSPVPAEGNTIGGVLNTVQETTTKVQGERQMRMLHELSARAASAKSADDAYDITAAVLATNDLDLPFVLLYSVDADRTEARLAAAAGLSAHDAPYRPERVALTGEQAGNSWPLAEALCAGHEFVVENLSERFGPLPAGRFGARPERAVVLPLFRTSPGSLYAFLVAGLSPHRAFDERYRRFFQATVDQVAAAIAAARAYEGERERAEALAEIDRSKTAFFSNVSHEFRTPLTLILGPVEDALSSAEKGLSGESLQAVHRNAVRLLKLVNALLEFSRAEARRFEVAREPVDLAMLTAGLAGSFTSVVGTAGLRLVVDCPPFPEPVDVDPSHWETIVLNLVSNAFKFTFEGEIGVSLRRRDEQVELRVWDTGTGIPPAELPHVFDRFHRVEGARGRSFEGTGIGLALVHELVTAHGGSVSVSSKQSKGTTFVVTIPAGSGQGEVAPRSEPTKPRRQGKRMNPYVMEAAQWAMANGSDAPVEVAVEPTFTPADVPTPSDRTRESGTILVVDDNADLRRYLTRLLEPRWHVEAVTNGAEALAVARARPPDLILSDMMMPVMDGSALVRALRDDPKTRTIVVILLSARAGQEAVLDGLDTGADDYLVKPFSARELVTRVATHLEMARARRAAFRELQSTQAQLVQAAKMASLGELVAGIAHQINNPLAFAVSHLNTVNLIVEGLKDKAGSNEDGASQARALDRLREMRLGLERIRELVLKLRTFSRLDEGEEKEVSVSESIEAVLMILGHRMQAGLVVEKQFGEPDVVTCNPELFNQAIMNLASNAIDAMNGGGTLTIATRADDSSYVMSVSDTGPGIPEAIRHRVLEPFFTTKPVGAGTGLGLSIAYSIVQKHGGGLELRARAEGGTEAIVRLPLARAVKHS